MFKYPFSLPLNVSKALSGRPLGFDLSRYQGKVDFKKAYDAGITFSFARASIGNYYADDMFAINFDGAKSEGIFSGAYLVVAPATSSDASIDAESHVEKFLKVLNGRIPDLPVVLDCELTRNRSVTYITRLIKDIIAYLPCDLRKKNPIIYTRQSWWDTNVSRWLLWYTFPLFAARYSSYLTSPWSDLRFRFRDWKQWTFWQWSADGNKKGKEFGVESDSIDLDWFNGTPAELQELCKVQ